MPVNAKHLFFSICLIVGLATVARAQDSTKSIVISGYIYEVSRSDGDSVQPLSSIAVVNLRNHVGTSSGRNGYFSINAQPGDPIYFRSIAHVPDTYFVSGDEVEKRIFLRVKLRRATLQLKQQEVYAISYSTFKHEIINMELKDTESVYIPPMLGYVEPNQSFAIIRFSPFTAIYNNFSKAGKEQKKLAKLLAEDKRQEFLDSIYKRKFVLNFLELPSHEMDDFIDYCNLSPQLLGRLTDFELLMALSECYEGYLRKKPYLYRGFKK